MDLLERFGGRLRVAMIGGGVGSYIGETHRIAIGEQTHSGRPTPDSRPAGPRPLVERGEHAVHLEVGQPANVAQAAGEQRRATADHREPTSAPIRPRSDTS
jgi:hypothetical protein